MSATHLLLAVGHDVDTGNARNCHDLLDYLNTQLLAFTDRVGGRLEDRGNVGDVAENQRAAAAESEWAPTPTMKKHFWWRQIAHPRYSARRRRSRVHGEKRGSRLSPAQLKASASENLLRKVYPVGDLVVPVISGGGMMGRMGGGMGGGAWAEWEAWVVVAWAEWVEWAEWVGVWEVWVAVWVAWAERRFLRHLRLGPGRSAKGKNESAAENKTIKPSDGSSSRKKERLRPLRSGSRIFGDHS